MTFDADFREDGDNYSLLINDESSSFDAHIGSAIVPFSFQTPYNLEMMFSGSLISGKARPYFPENFSWLPIVSGLTPRIDTFLLLKDGKLSWKSQASVVHPGVLSLG